MELNVNQQMLEAYIKNDRQWRREHRMAHARYQIKRLRAQNDPTNAEQIAFWRAVLERNTRHD